MDIGAEVALHSLKMFSKSHQGKCLSEDTKLSADAELFKGVWVKYLGEFAVRLISERKSRFSKLSKYIFRMLQRTARILVEDKMNIKGEFSTYWCKNEPNQFTTKGQISAINLFMALDKINKIISY